MRGTLLRSLAFASLLCLTRLACDDGRADDEALTDLTEDESIALCEDLDGDELAATSHALGCDFVAIAFSEGDAAACQSSVDDCLDQEPTPCDCEAEIAADGPLPACASGITVGELRACAEARRDRFERLADEISCATQPDGISAELTALPASCMALAAECPALSPE